MMDPKIYFWSASLVLFVALVASALAGWRAIRRQDIGRHKRWMNLSAVLVFLFVASYVVKVLVLGKEELGLWSAGDRAVLWTHESFVFVMILAGTAARLLARKLDPARRGAQEAPTTRRRHRLLGRTAVIASVLGALTAALVLTGMFLRAG
jgi:uncharacterized membrane protein YozB (DUF420 family)